MENNSNRDIRYIGIWLGISILGDIMQSIVEGFHNKMHIIITILLIVFFIFIIPIIQKNYFSIREEKLKNKAKNEIFFSLIGLTCFGLIISYIVVYMLNILNFINIR